MGCFAAGQTTKGDGLPYRAESAAAQPKQTTRNDGLLHGVCGEGALWYGYSLVAADHRQ